MSLQTDVEAAVAALATVQTDVTNQEPTTADTVLSAVVPALTPVLVATFGAPALVSQLEDEGYTVTAPEDVGPNATSNTNTTA